MHELSPDFFDLAVHPGIVNRVKSILGPDLLAWGTSTRRIGSRDGHRWHVDVEHRHWRGVSVFLGLRNLTDRSTLKLIAGSQNIRATPQQAGVANEYAALDYCRRFNPQSELKIVNPGDGGFFIFDGPLWHGSRNEEAFGRDAAIIQYCTPDQRVRIPVSFGDVVEWHPLQPGCALAAGADGYGVNRLVSRPA